ncbi:MAG: radical SAM protein [Promethearchaeota archaeon]|nr:MAG: radical SAM protein [Candidatus Lokiarchaeota archaeon]
MTVHGILIRPPVEAYSLLINVTEGCRWNKCRFCGVYRNQPYWVRPLDLVFKEIEINANQYGNDFINRVFLAGGSAFSAPTEHLVKIIKKVAETFPNTLKEGGRISSYAKNHDILRKSPEEIKKIQEAGLKIVYMGLESGSDKILKMMRKGTTKKLMESASKKLMESGIQLSLYIILGLGGRDLSEEHALKTAEALNEINPDKFRFRTLNIIPISELWKERNTFPICPPWMIIKEELTILENLGDHVTSEVYNDHMSNYISIEGKLPEDRERMIKYLRILLKDPQVKNLKHKGLLSM